MAKFYFTFGDSKEYPYRGGWVTIDAPNKDTAMGIFAGMYPNGHRKHDDFLVLNCADIYTEERFNRTILPKAGKLGAFCHAEYQLITINPLTGQRKRGRPCKRYNADLKQCAVSVSLSF